MKRIVCLLSFVSICLSAFSYDIEIDGLYYNELSFIGKKIALTASPEGNKYAGEIVIPDVVNIEGYSFKVAEIEAKAFANCSELTKLTIGANVETIGEGAFIGCTSLTMVSFEDSDNEVFCNPRRKSYMESTFYDCPLDSIYIGRNLDYYTSQLDGYSPFFFWVNDVIRSVKFGDRVTTVKRSLFSSNKNLNSIELGNSIKVIEDGAFSSTNISEIVFPESLDSLGSQVFQFCRNLLSVISLRKDPRPIREDAFDAGGYAQHKPLENCTLYVPTSCVEKYRNLAGWSKFKWIEEIRPSFICFEIIEDTIKIGEKITPVIQYLPTYADLGNCSWSSSDTNVAIVNENGEIEGVGEGTAIITASIIGTDVSAQLNIVVEAVKISSLTFADNTITLGIAQQYQFTPIILPENASNKSLNWYSSNSSAVIVSNSGLATRVGNGESIIMAMTLDGTNLVASCTVKDETEAIQNIYSDYDFSELFNIDATRKNHKTKGLNVIREADGSSRIIFIK